MVTRTLSLCQKRGLYVYDCNTHVQYLRLKSVRSVQLGAIVLCLFYLQTKGYYWKVLPHPFHRQQTETMQARQLVLSSESLNFNSSFRGKPEFQQEYMYSILQPPASRTGAAERPAIRKEGLSEWSRGKEVCQKPAQLTLKNSFPHKKLNQLDNCRKVISSTIFSSIFFSFSSFPNYINLNIYILFQFIIT